MQAIKDAYKATANWIAEHKAEIAGFVVGAIVGVACGVAIGWTGVGAVACGFLAGAAGSLVTGLMQGKRGWDLVATTAIGCSASGFLGAAGSGAAEGAKWGALAGGIFGGLGGVKGGGGCRGHSFTPETKVLLASGATVAIAAVKVGDEVMATDPETGKSEPKPVTALHLNRDTELTDVTVTVKDGERAGEQVTLKTTKHHPFWDATAERWTDAADLEPGHELLVYDETKEQLDATTEGSGQGGGGPPARVTVAKVENYFSAKDMHDLTVADTHTYYVMAGNTPVLVHNTGDDDLVRVGRWMSQAEYDTMLRTGRVQSGAGGLTYVVHPASPDAYKPTYPGSVYAEFDVPRSSLIPGGRPGDYKMADADTLMGRYLAKKGGTPGMPNATNIGPCS